MKAWLLVGKLSIILRVSYELLVSKQYLTHEIFDPHQEVELFATS